jgi:hypothetical protein
MHFLQKLEICCNFFSILFVLSCFSIFPIVQIVQGTYFNNMNCTDDLLSINIWLIIIGSFEILQVFLSIINIFIKNYILYHIINLVHLFNFSWLITGSVIFFRDCNGLSTSDNLLFYCTFIYGFSFVLVCTTSKHNYKNIIIENDDKESLYIVI